MKLTITFSEQINMKVKIKKAPKVDKAEKAAKLANFKAAHHKTVRHDGNFYLIRVQTVGTMILADAELVKGNAPLVNLFSKSKLAMELKQLCESRIYS
jgi:hemin uptake protein HemP